MTSWKNPFNKCPACGKKTLIWYDVNTFKCRKCDYSRNDIGVANKKSKCDHCAARIFYKWIPLGQEERFNILSVKIEDDKRIKYFVKELERATKERNMLSDALGLAVEWFQQQQWHGTLHKAKWIKWRKVFNKLCRALDKCSPVEASAGGPAPTSQFR